MKSTLTQIALAGFLVFGLAACGGLKQVNTENPSVNKDRVRQDMEGLQQGLRTGTWSRVERYFSPAYFEGYGELRTRVEDQMRRQTLIDLQFDVTRVLEIDGLVNAQVRWKKSWVDNSTGTPRKAEGLSEFILKPKAGGSYRVLAIRGNPPF